MKRKLVGVIIALLLALLNVAPVMAAVVTVTYNPRFTAGITSFTITYINEHELDLAWTVDPTVDMVMVRAKYGEYPHDIPNENVAPTDGYLVYYGFDFSTIDTSMDFDENPGFLYYKAWAQKPTGKWYVNTSTGKEESRVMALLALLGLGLVVSGFSIHKRNTIIGIVSSAIWLAIIAYTRANPIGSMTTGDTADTAILLALIGLMVLVPIISWQLGKKENMRETKDDDYKERVAPRKTKVATGGIRESSSDYYERLKRVTHTRR